MAPHAGILLAAGRGRRMGATKQLLPVPGGDTPLVVAAFDLLAPTCGPHMVVVLGHDAHAVAAALQPRAFVAAASDPDADMLHSVKVGLAAARRAFPEAPAYWLHLADHPFVAPSTVQLLLRAFAQDPTRACLPQVHGKGGHPAVIPPDIADQLIAWHGDGGVRAFWLQHPDRCTRVDLSDPGATHDIDTPDQYHRPQ